MSRLPDTATVRAGEELDWSSLETYLRGELPDLSGAFEVLQFPHGSANLTYLVTIGDTRLVVRRPPFGRIAPGAHDMAREHRVLHRLHRSFPRAPYSPLFTDDVSIIGSPFLVIEYRPGYVVRRNIPPEVSTAEDVGYRIGLATVDALADLHQVAPDSCDLGDLGRPAGYLERQVGGWASRWEAVSGGEAAELMVDVGRRLARQIPAPQRAAVLHNDFKVDNCQFADGDPDHVVSVFDWDMATLGDPLADLGMLLNYWPRDADAPEVLHATAVAGLEPLGLPPRDVVVDRYASATGLDLTAIDWYEAFACWKTAVILQQLYVRYLRGESTDPRMAERGKSVFALAQKAAYLLDRLG